MANTKKVFRAVKHLASDMKQGCYTKAQLAKACEAEAVRLDMPADDLVRKVNAAYTATYIYGE